MFMANETTAEIERCLDSYSTIKSTFDSSKLTNQSKPVQQENSSNSNKSSVNLTRTIDKPITSYSSFESSIKLRSPIKTNDLSSIEKKAFFSDNSLSFLNSTTSHQTSDLLHINNLVKSDLNQNLNLNFIKTYNTCNSNDLHLCDCKFNSSIESADLFSEKCDQNLNNNFVDQCDLYKQISYENDLNDFNKTDYLLKTSELCKSLKGDLYDQPHLNSPFYKKDLHNSFNGQFMKNSINFSKNIDCENCLFKTENCSCANLITAEQPTFNPTSCLIKNPINLNSNLSSLNNPEINSRAYSRITKYFQPQLIDQNRNNLTYFTNQISQSSPTLSTHRSLSNCACLNCFDLISKSSNKSKFKTNSQSDSLFDNLKTNHTSSNNSSSLNSSNSSSSNLSVKSSSKYLSNSSSCLIPNKLNLLLRLVRKLYFYICFLIAPLIRLVPFGNTKPNQHKLCEHRNNNNKIMRLKERVVILMIAACCVLCTFFVLQLKISEDMDSSTKFR